ncbi:MAG: signal peptide peptidase SppA [Myxococcales bacterium FL481]|nr:MAG: signal peptide peptidase SppA [Myxococcales bacterium FL481]
MPTTTHLLARIACCLALVTGSLTSLRAAADDPIAQGRVRTDGVDRTVHDYSGEGDASSLELNPALLSATPDLDLVVRHYRTYADFARGSGTGGFVSLRLPVGVAMGFGIQGVSPGFRHDQFDEHASRHPTLTKFSYGLALGAAEVGALGVSLHNSRVSGERLRAPDVDLGALIRMTNFASLGVVARFAPVSREGDDATTVLTSELAIRPLGTRQIEVAGGVTADLPVPEVDGQAQTATWLPRARLALRHEGIAVTGEVQQVRTTVLDDESYAVLRHAKGWRGSVGLALAWDYAAVFGGAHSAFGPSLGGYEFGVRFSAKRQGRTYWPRSVDAELIDIGELNDERDLLSALAALHRAKEAGERSVIVLDTRGSKLGWASLQELRQAVIDLRQAGGHVFAYLERASTKDYYLASAAQAVFMHPAGGLSMPGLSTTTLYYKDALAKVGVAVEAIHIEEFKSAHEPYSRSSRSKPDRLQRDAILDAVYTQIRYDMARGRELSITEVTEAIEDSPHTPKLAQQRGFVDKVLFRDQVIEEVSERIGANVEFAEFDPPGPERPTWSKHPYIAVVLIEGSIIDGNSVELPLLGTKMTGGDTIVQTLRDLRSDPACEGVVLRVNSPGGSALASDVIWREVQRTREAHDKDPKFSPPIVVSMGDIAGSGGYYVAMGADTVLASDLTITGSIGVVSQHFDASGLLKMLGISVDTLKRGENPDMFEPYHPFTADQKQRLRESMEATYELFRQRVASARNLTPEKVHELGRGRVYAGVDARKLGLVDEAGGLLDAIELVRARAGLRRGQKTRIRVAPSRATVLGMILESAGLPQWLRSPKMKERPTPMVVDLARAKLPLSMLYLDQDRPLALMPGVIDIE